MTNNLDEFSERAFFCVYLRFCCRHSNNGKFKIPPKIVSTAILTLSLIISIKIKPFRFPKNIFSTVPREIKMLRNLAIHVGQWNRRKVPKINNKTQNQNFAKVKRAASFMLSVSRRLIKPQPKQLLPPRLVMLRRHPRWAPSCI